MSGWVCSALTGAVCACATLTPGSDNPIARQRRRVVPKEVSAMAGRAKRASRIVSPYLKVSRLSTVYRLSDQGL
ncbi:hypothetical protein XHC_1586 [Xanthomonas hortorum pv. carotae str. M081]|nr:hypothetical protein XHC_1586 [Xanthomonas hortorum pv. carotae str. M081]